MYIVDLIVVLTDYTLILYMVGLSQKKKLKKRFQFFHVFFASFDKEFVQFYAHSSAGVFEKLLFFFVERSSDVG